MYMNVYLLKCTYVYDARANVYVVNRFLDLSQMVPLFHESIETLIARLAKRAEEGQETEAIECVECMHVVRVQ